MSAPIRDKDCRCIVGTKYNRYDSKPFWTYYGKTISTELENNCSKNNPRHAMVSHRKEIKLFGIVVGYLKWNESNPERKEYSKPQNYAALLGTSGGIIGEIATSGMRSTLSNMFMSEVRESRGGRWSKYIVIDKHKFINWFKGKDVYCNECDKWHFK